MRRISSVVFLLVLTVSGILLIQGEEEFDLDVYIPTIFGQKTKSEEVISIVNNWFPGGVLNKNSQAILLSAKSAIIVDYESGEVLFAKDVNKRLPAASTIKIMTALIAMENAKLSQEFVVSANAVRVGENSMNLLEGEKLTLDELLYGLMLVSGNDAAITIAEGVAGDEQTFVNLMNQKIEALGLKDSKFVNVTGLDEDKKQQYSTVYDLATISHFIWENYREFRKITSTYEKYIEASAHHQDYLLYNDTNLLTSYPGVKGIKPGFTWNAGLSLVTYAENGGKKLIAVILGSENRRGEMIMLLDYGFGVFGIKVDHPGLDLQL